MLNAQINILCNMAEMVVRHVEKAWVAEIRRNTAVSDTANALKRSPASYNASHPTTRLKSLLWLQCMPAMSSKRMPQMPLHLVVPSAQSCRRLLNCENIDLVHSASSSRIDCRPRMRVRCSW